jgi:hypothetical protein
LRRLGPGASGKARALVDHLDVLAGRVTKIAEQCEQRISGVTPEGATRVVSLHDPDARPIAKGRLGKPVRNSQDLWIGLSVTRRPCSGFR